MFVTIVLLLFFASLVGHEAGHALAMRKYGIPIKAFGIGLPVPHMPMVCLAFERAGKRVFTLEFNLLPLGAYVRMDDEGPELCEKLPLRKQAVIFAAGIMVNIAFAIVLLLTQLCFFGGVSVNLFAIFFLAGLLVVIAIWPTYSVPTIGFLMAVILIFSVYMHPFTALQGPVGIVQYTNEQATSWKSLLPIASLLSLSLALINTLPLIPLDGGRIVAQLLKRSRFSLATERFESYSGLAFIGLLVLVVASDVISLFR